VRACELVARTGELLPRSEEQDRRPLSRLARKACAGVGGVEVQHSTRLSCWSVHWHLRYSLGSEEIGLLQADRAADALAGLAPLFETGCTEGPSAAM
jgi:hypothetical protein